MPDGSEIELKLRIRPAMAGRLSRMKRLAGTKPRTARLRTVYYDDRKRRLTRRGLELRVRFDGESHVQTVKAGSGLLRGEWEAPLPDALPCLEALRGTPAGAVVKDAGRRSALFDVEVERRVWTVEFGDGVAEVSIDTGRIEAEGRQAPLAEAEVELKRGSLATLIALARDLIGACGGTPSLVGKALQGRRLLEDRFDDPETGLVQRLDGAGPTAEAFTRALTGCLELLSVNTELLDRRPGSVEAVHQARVSVRRIRTVLALFKPVLSGPDFDQLRREFKWLSDLLGAVRDLDVLVSGPLAQAAQRHPHVGPLADLRREAETMRDEAFRELAGGLGSERFRELLLGAVAFMHDGAWRHDPLKADLRQMPYRRFATRALDKRLRWLGTREARARVAGDDETARHHVRIRAKTLHIMTEFMDGVVPGKVLRPCRVQLKTVQSTLGDVHDSVAAEQLLSRIVARREAPELSFAAAIVMGDGRGNRARIDAAGAALKTLRKAAP